MCSRTSPTQWCTPTSPPKRPPTPPPPSWATPGEDAVCFYRRYLLRFCCCAIPFCWCGSVSLFILWVYIAYLKRWIFYTNILLVWILFLYLFYGYTSHIYMRCIYTRDGYFIPTYYWCGYCFFIYFMGINRIFKEMDISYQHITGVDTVSLFILWV